MRLPAFYAIGGFLRAGELPSSAAADTSLKEGGLERSPQKAPSQRELSSECETEGVRPSTKKPPLPPKRAAAAKNQVVVVGVVKGFTCTGVEGCTSVSTVWVSSG